MALQEDRAPETRLARQVFYESGPKIGQPGFNSTKVGWTLRSTSGRILHAVSFYLNPQGITRGLTSRSQVFATKGGFYVDAFGPGPNNINVRQLVASGKRFTDGRQYTAREDVQRFLKLIYLPSIQNTRNKVFFHDNHFERGFEEQVYFVAESMSIQRAVDLHHVWLVEFTMIGLERYPYAEVDADPQRLPSPNAAKLYVVKKGDTLNKLAARIAGKGSTHAKRVAALHRIIALNPQVKHARKVNIDGKVHTVKAMKLLRGETIRLPR